jgi:hypothetical protein
MGNLEVILKLLCSLLKLDCSFDFKYQRIFQPITKFLQ